MGSVMKLLAWQVLNIRTNVHQRVLFLTVGTHMNAFSRKHRVSGLLRNTPASWGSLVHSLRERERWRLRQMETAVIAVRTP